MSSVATQIRIPLTRALAVSRMSGEIFAAIEPDDERYLDCVDAVLNVTRGQDAPRLREILRSGGSAWTVSKDGTQLERRVSESAGQMFEHASMPADSAATELREAWSQAFGRHPNPSDAWDHAIKAVEDVLIPIVTPKMSKANLGSVAGELAAHPEKWDFDLPANGSRGNGETLEGLVRHIWPNPDRHGGAAKRQPTPAEAEAAVQVAVLVVLLCRNRLTKLP
ncbi:MAG: hypothetical protein ACREV8_00495 [Gammaproteobacteria bacterium]